MVNKKIDCILILKTRQFLQDCQVKNLLNRRGNLDRFTRQEHHNKVIP